MQYVPWVALEADPRHRWCLCSSVWTSPQWACPSRWGYGGWCLYILTSNENATPKLTSLFQGIYFYRGFLATLWIQNIDTILSLLGLTWNVRSLYTCARSSRCYIGIFRISICKSSLAKIPKIMFFFVKWYELSGILNSIFLMNFF